MLASLVTCALQSWQCNIMTGSRKGVDLPSFVAIIRAEQRRSYTKDKLVNVSSIPFKCDGTKKRERYPFNVKSRTTGCQKDWTLYRSLALVYNCCERYKEVHPSYEHVIAMSFPVNYMYKWKPIGQTLCRSWSIVTMEMHPMDRFQMSQSMQGIYCDT